MTFGVLHIKLPNGQTREFPLDQPVVAVGRAPDNQLVIEDNSISRRHARVSVESGQLLLEDLGSANGSFVGGQRLAANTPTPVPENQAVRLGDVELQFTPPPRSASSAQATVILPQAGVPPSAPTKFGTLRLKLPGGESREFSLDQPSVSVGRAEDNRLVIDDASVSRRHARLSVESGRLMIEDLGSANGTFIGSQRVAPNTPSLVSEDQTVRLGDVEIRYSPPPPVEAARAFSPAEAQASPAAAPSGPPVNLSLAGPTQPVAPGSVTTATLTVQNRGLVVDEFLVVVSGLPAAWVRLSRDRVPLLPNAQEQITLTFQPPRRSEAVATDQRFIVSVASSEHNATVTAQGVLKILPFQGFVLGLQPMRSQRDFNVVAHNQGNAPVEYGLSASDDEHGLDFQFGRARVALQPGERVMIPLRVMPKVKPRVGARETRAFTVIGLAAEPNAPEVKAAGQLIIRPPIPVWLILLALFLMLCCCFSSVWAYLTFCPTYAPNLPFCPSAARPIINVFSATPTEVEKGGTVVISWDVSNAARVELVSPTQETLEASGLKEFVVDQNTTFTLRVTNFTDEPVEQSVVVRVIGSPPVIQSFSANPSGLISGQTDTVVLSWTVIGADSVSIEGVPAQTFDPGTGNITIPAPATTTTYKLVATNDAGTVEQELQVMVTSAGCVVNNTTGNHLNLRSGPGVAYTIVETLDNGTPVEPLGRNGTAEWLKIRAVGKEGWVSTDFITCSVAFNVFPTVDPASIPTAAPTNTPLPPATPTPTATPLFNSSGFVTYRVQSGGRTTIYLQGPTGGPVPLVTDKDDAEVLDFTPAQGGRFAIWVSESGTQRLFIIGTGGNLIAGPINPGWDSVVDGDWSIDGQRLVIEAVTGGKPAYYFFDANGNPTGQPALP